MKCFYNKHSSMNKFVLLLMLIIMMEVQSLEQNISSEINNFSRREKYARRNLLKRNQERMREQNEFNKNSQDFRFKSSLELNMKDGDENDAVVANAIITDQRKEAALPEEKENELRPSSADAGTEYSSGFLLWSYMSWGAENALSGHGSGNWQSKEGVNHDFWSARFDGPTSIDTVEIHWKIPPKRMKIFYKLDEQKDWIGATEVYIKEELKDGNGNTIPQTNDDVYYTIYFKKSLLCHQFKIMMNNPVKKKTFAIYKVGFFNKVNIGILKAPLIDTKINNCWFINSNMIRPGLPIFTYPCVEGISVPIGTSLFSMFPNNQIRPFNQEVCIGNSGNDVILSECQESSAATQIFLNDDYTMYFKGRKSTPISIDVQKKNVNLINGQSDISASSEADTNQYKKENMLNEGNATWQSAVGDKDVTIQIHFGKIKCEDCKEKGKFEAHKVDAIRIKWSREPKKFSVFLWHPGHSWKSVANFENNSEKMTNISQIQDTASAIMIRISDGNSYDEFEKQVVYALTSVAVFFNGSKLILKGSDKVSTEKKFFDFESQAVLYKKKGNAWDEEIKNLGKTYEKSIATYKIMKKTIPAVEVAIKTNKEMVKKLEKLNDLVKAKQTDKLLKYEKNEIKKIKNNKFYKYLNQFDQIDKTALENILDIKTDANSDDIFAQSKSNPLANLNALLNKKDKPLAGPSKMPEKPAKKDEGEVQNVDELGSFENPANNCMQIKMINKSALSGFYFIQPECADAPLRVFCDFALFETAVDIHLYKDGSSLKTPNLQYLHIKTAEDVANECANVGLHPLEIRSKEMIARIQNLAIVSGMALSYPAFIPLGYDYSCTGVKCADVFNSLNKKASDPIMNFFNDKGKSPKKPKTSFQFVGLGDPDKMAMTRYNEKKMEMAALICSTNVTNEEQETKKFKIVDCAFTLNDNMDIFSSSKERILVCPKGCVKGAGEVFGAGTYNGKSSICKAAVHEGVISDLGGKVVVRIDKPMDNYAGTNANGVDSKVMPSDGSKSFLVFKYKPDCPKKKPMTSFIAEDVQETSLIEEEENMFLDNEKILDDALGIKHKKTSKDVEIDSLISNMGKYGSKKNVKNKRDLINNQLIPQLNLVGNKADLNNINMEKYRFSQKAKLKELENSSGIPSMPGLPSLPSVPGGLNSGALADAGQEAAKAAGFGKNVLGDVTDAAKSLFGKDEDGKENKPSSTGAFNPPTDLMGNTPSSPAVPRSWSEEQNRNLLPAMSKAPSFEDPTKQASKPDLTDTPKSTAPPDPSNPNPDPPQIAEPELPGKKKKDPEDKFDLSQAGQKPADPLENVPDEDEKEPEPINKDIPTNTKNKGETTDTAKARLRIIYNSGYFHYLDFLKKKFDKINDSIKKFIELNTPLFGNKGTDLENCETNVCFNEGGNIVNMPDVYNIIYAKAKRMSNLIEKLLDRINARIYKTNGIKQKWKDMYADLTAQDTVKIDYTIYPNSDIATDKIFGEIFEEQKIGSEPVLNPAKWSVIERGIKGRPKVMGIEFLPTDTTNGSSNLVLQDKVYYDFKLKFDVLISEGGSISVNFRQKDNFNYYSFIIDKKSGNKILSKNINGNMEILHTIQDGAISVNQWHTVDMDVMANKIKIIMYDAESTSRSSTEKTIEVFDSSFIKGTMGFNISGVKGFYFDEYSISSFPCWSAWEPKEDLDIKNTNANLYDEAFDGKITEKYEQHNGSEFSSFLQLSEGDDDGPIKDGPAMWSIQDGGTFEPNYIFQENKTYDSSPLKKPNFLILKDKHYQHGTYVVKFIPYDSDGIISIIFKYENEKNKEKYYTFELNNERKEMTFDLKLINGKQTKTIASKNASQINDFKKKAYIPNKLNFVHIECINDKISIKVSHDYRDLQTIFNINDQTLFGGLVGFGTYKTPSRFTTIRMYPPELKLTPNDVDKILTTSPSRLFSTIGFPSPKKINDVYIALPKKFLPFGADAPEDIKSQVSAFASSLGYNFRKDSQSADAPAGGDDKDNKDKNGGGAGGPGGDGKQGDSAGWKQCIMARSEKDRSTWCSNTFPSEFLKKKCEQTFCDNCCEKNTAPNDTNVKHMCKKGCFRASIAAENNKEYKNVCINSPNSVQNIYAFCEEKMTTFSPILINACKLDMCNLCCVGMDTIKNKNYSVPNLKECFRDCSKNYNIVIADKDIPTDKRGDVPDPDGEKCDTVPAIDIKDINKEEKFDSSFLIEMAKLKK